MSFPSSKEFEMEIKAPAYHDNHVSHPLRKVGMMTVVDLDLGVFLVIALNKDTPKQFPKDALVHWIL